MENKLKLSEIIKTDCYIDCGTNEKLREVYPLIDMQEFSAQKKMGILTNDCVIYITFVRGMYQKVTSDITMPNTETPIHHISQIDLNN